MALYVTKSVNFGSRLESFKDRGLNNEAACRVSESSIFPIGVPTNSFTLAIQNIFAELKSRIEKKPEFYEGSMQNLLQKFEGTMFEAPVLMVEYKQGGEELNSLGMFEAGTGKMGVYAGTPTIPQVRQIATLGINIFATVQAGNVNLGGEFAYIWAWRGINAYLSIGGGESMIFPQFQLSKTVVRNAVRANFEYLQKVVGSGKGKEGVEAENLIGGLLPLTDGRIGTKGETGFLDVKLQCVKDFTFEPPTGGFAFFFFKEMLDADPDFAFNQFMSLFKRCIADTPEEFSELVTMLRRGFRYLASTTAGKIIQHIYFGISLSVATGGTLNLLRDGQAYAGFILETNAQLIVKNRLLNALPKEELQKVIASLNTHRSAVESIIALVEGMADIEERIQEPSLEKALSSPRYLRSQIIQCRPDLLIDARKELVENIGKLSYDQTFWAKTPENITRFLVAMSTKSDISEEPMYVSSDTMLNSTSEVLPYIAVFGPTAPSVYHGDTPRPVKELGHDDPNLVVVSDKRVVPHVPVYFKGLSAAAGDWISVRNTKAFKYVGPKQNEAGKFSSARSRDLVIANPQFGEFYTALRMWAYSKKEVVNPVIRKGKRQAEDMDEDREEGTSKKQKKLQSFV